MKNQLLQLGKYLFLSGALLFLGCQAEEIAVEQQANSEKEIILKKITFKEFRSNKKAFENFKKAQLKRSLASKNRGAYDESYGVFVDTSNIFVIERDGKHSITLKIESESDDSKIENLVLNSKDGGGYSAYIAEYQLSSQEQSVLLNGGVLPGKTPSHITSLETSSRINIGGDGADCIDIITRTVNMCHDANGNAQIDNGDLGNGCVGTFYELEITTILVDYACMTGGGDGGLVGTGSPGNTGSGDSGGFGGSGGTPGPGNDGSPPSNTGGNTGIPHNPDASLTDGDGNPVLTTPILIVDRVRDFYRDLDVEQKAWWNSAENAVEVGIIKRYLNQNANDEGQQFAEEAIEAFMEDGEVDFEKRIIYTINKPCQKEILKNMMAISSPLTNLIKNTFDSSENVNVKFWNGNISAQAPNANAYVNPQYAGTSSSFIIKIGFDDNFLDTGTNLAIVAVTLHELVHAYFYSLYAQNKLIATNPSYNTLQNAFIAFYANANPQTYNPLDNELHNVMNSFMDKIANTIYNYAQSNNIGGVTQDYCLSLAWGTMEGTDLFEQMLSLDQQANANHTFMTEQNNTQYDTAFPIKGMPCQ